jgi:RNA polymerase sigma factor (sigma-70 family)
MAQLEHVEIWARYYAEHYAVPYDELYAVGSLGLAEAMSRFDMSRGVRLSTIAVPYIRGSQRNFILRNHRRPPVCVPMNGRDPKVPLDTPSPEDTTVNGDSRLAALAESVLTPREAAVVDAVIKRDLSLVEAAAALGLSRETVRKTRISALGKMREAVGCAR